MRPKKTILCVDDNEQVLSVRTFLLETRGYRIIAANTAQEALANHSIVKAYRAEAREQSRFTAVAQRVRRGGSGLPPGGGRTH